MSLYRADEFGGKMGMEYARVSEQEKTQELKERFKLMVDCGNIKFSEVMNKRVDELNDLIIVCTNVLETQYKKLKVGG